MKLGKDSSDHDALKMVVAKGMRREVIVMCRSRCMETTHSDITNMETVLGSKSNNRAW